MYYMSGYRFFFFFQAEDGIRDGHVNWSSDVCSSDLRWHFHRVCARGNLRGLKPLSDGTCPSGETLREGSEMLHVWFTDDRRSAYAIHAPEPELCAARLLPVGYCASGRSLRGM